MREVDAAAVPPQFAAYAARIRGRIYMAQEQPDRARSEFERASELAPKNIEAMIDLARFRMTSGDAAGGEQLVNRALALDPTSIKALMLKGEYTRARYGLAKSLPYFNQALQVDPNNIEALLARAGTYGDLKREQEARADLARVQGLIPDHPLALYQEAVLEARAGRYDRATALMTRTKGTLSTYAPALLLQGVLAYQQNELQQADQYLARVLAKAPNSEVARKLHAAVLLRKGDAAGAIRTLEPVTNSGRVDARTLAMLGTAHARLGQYDTAQQYLERAAKAAPSMSGVRTQLALTRAAQGNSSGADAELEAVLKADPNSLQALMLATMLDLRKRDYAAALKSADRIVKAHPQLPMGFNMRGAAMLGLRNLKGAEANFRAAIQKKPDFVEARRNLGLLLAATGRPAAGRQELLRVVEIRPDDVSAMTALARMAAGAGNRADQISWLRRAAAAKPLVLEPRAALVQAYAAAGQPNRSVTEARALERDFARNPAALQVAGLAYLSARQTQDAESAFNRLASLRSGDVGPRVLLARTQALQGQTDAARRTLEEALRLPKQNLLPAYAELISLELRARRTPQALAVTERMRRTYPRQNIADVAAGDINLAAGRIPQAIASYEAARKVSFDRTVAGRLASAQLRARQPAQAVATMQAYRKANPRDMLAAAQTADIYLEAKQVRPALAIYETMHRQGQGQNNPAILNNMAWAYHQLGDKRALAFGERALKLAPQAPAIQDTVGQILVETKQNPKRGLALLQAAAKASPRDPGIRFHLAQAYRANGRPADAARELQVVLKTPGFDRAPQARQMLAQLRRS
jgi:putative PEP-CTERM system TPR-repeat lipoprotein